jgi:hypothetical protein
MTTNILRFERANVNFGGDLQVDGYRTPDGEFRVGITGSSTVLGFKKQWLSQLLTRNGIGLKTLSGYGFTGSQITGRVDRDNISGSSEVKTISLDDFALLILYGATQGKKEAISLQLALTKLSLNDFFRDAFGDRPLTIEEKRALFYQDYAKTINWLNEDQIDWTLIEEQELFLALN